MDFNMDLASFFTTKSTTVTYPEQIAKEVHTYNSDGCLHTHVDERNLALSEREKVIS